MVAVILIAATAVAITIILALWMQSTTTHYAQFQTLTPQGSWSSRQDGELVVVCRLQNSGTAPVAIANVMLNGKPFRSIGSDISVVVGTPSAEKALDPDAPQNYVDIPPGETVDLKIRMPDTSVPRGDKLTVGVVTSDGMEYIVTVAVD